MPTKEVIFTTWDRLPSLRDIGLLVVSIDEASWRSGRVPAQLKTVRWLDTRTSIALTFSGIDDSPFEIWEVPEIRTFCRDALAIPGFAKRLVDDSDASGESIGAGLYLILACADVEFRLGDFLPHFPGEMHDCRARVTVNAERGVYLEFMRPGERP